MLCIDMRRMNRIVSIDRKNRVAIVEPYVFADGAVHRSDESRTSSNMIGAGPVRRFWREPRRIRKRADNISTGLLVAVTCSASRGAARRGHLALGPVRRRQAGQRRRPGPSLRGIVRGYGGTNVRARGVRPSARSSSIRGTDARAQACGNVPQLRRGEYRRTSKTSASPSQPAALSDFQHLLYEETIAFAQERPGWPSSRC